MYCLLKRPCNNKATRGSEIGISKRTKLPMCLKAEKLLFCYDLPTPRDDTLPIQPYLVVSRSLKNANFYAFFRHSCSVFLHNDEKVENILFFKININKWNSTSYEVPLHAPHHSWWHKLKKVTKKLFEKDIDWIKLGLVFIFEI